MSRYKCLKTEMSEKSIDRVLLNKTEQLNPNLTQYSIDMNGKSFNVVDAKAGNTRNSFSKD